MLSMLSIDPLLDTQQLLLDYLFMLASLVISCSFSGLQFPSERLAELSDLWKQLSAASTDKGTVEKGGAWVREMGKERGKNMIWYAYEWVSECVCVCVWERERERERER